MKIGDGEDKIYETEHKYRYFIDIYYIDDQMIINEDGYTLVCNY